MFAAQRLLTHRRDCTASPSKAVFVTNDAAADLFNSLLDLRIELAFDKFLVSHCLSHDQKVGRCTTDGQHHQRQEKTLDRNPRRVYWQFDSVFAMVLIAPIDTTGLSLESIQRLDQSRLNARTRTKILGAA